MSPPPLTQTLGLYTTDRLAASVERECFFLNSYNIKAPGLAFTGQIWVLCSSLIKSLCT